MSEPKTIRIAAQNEYVLDQRLAVLQKKATKLGVVFPDIIKSPMYVIHHRDSITGNAWDTFHVDYTLTGEGIDQPVSYGNWEILGAFNHEYETGVIPNLLVDDVNPEFRARFEASNVSYCEHCRRKQRRLNTYAIRSLETGHQMLVGSSCMADFVPMKKPLDSVIAFYQTIADVDFSDLDDEGYHGGQPHYADTKTTLVATIATYISNICHHRDDYFMCVVMEVVNRQGKLSSAAQAVLANMDAAKVYYDQMMGEYYDNLDETNDFTLKLKRIAGCAGYRERDLRTLVWIVFNFFKELGIESTRKVDGTPDANEFMGEVGGVVQSRVTLLSAKFLYSSEWGDQYLYVFKTPEGNTITWKTNPRDIVEGTTWDIKGRVKEHSEFSGINQTQLTRPTLKEVL